MKMMKIFIVLIFFSLSLTVYAQKDYSNPFESVLPDVEEKPTGPGKKVVTGPPNVTVEGILWGNKTPQAIISGEVYKVGDNLRGLNATLLRIEQNVVVVSYEGKIFKMRVRKRGKK